MKPNAAARYYLADLRIILRNGVLAGIVVTVILALIGMAARLGRSGKFDPEVFLSVWPVGLLTFVGAVGFALTGSVLVRQRFRREHYASVDDPVFLDREFRKTYRKSR